MTARRTSPGPRSAPTLRIREISSSDDPALGEAYALLRQSFEAHERTSIADWRSTLDEKSQGLWSDVAWHLLIAEREGHVVGLSTGMYVGSVNVGVVGYLAIAPSERAAGVGTRLRGRLRKAFAADAPRLVGQELEGIVGEVREDNPWLASLARRPGVIVLDLPYFQPELRADDGPSPFLLYYESMRGPRSWLPVAELRRILYAIWRRSYRVARPLHHRAFRRMMKALESRRRISRHPSFRRKRSR